MWMLFWQLASVFAYSPVHMDHFSTHSSQSVHTASNRTHPRHHNFFVKVLGLAKMAIRRVWFWELRSVCQCIVLSYILLKLNLVCGSVSLPTLVWAAEAPFHSVRYDPTWSFLCVPLRTNEVVEVGQHPTNPCETCLLLFYSYLNLLILFDFLLSYGKNLYILDIIFVR